MIMQRYHFGAYSQPSWCVSPLIYVVYDNAKIPFWSLFTTAADNDGQADGLFMIMQRYHFGAYSQRMQVPWNIFCGCL